MVINNTIGPIFNSSMLHLFKKKKKKKVKLNSFQFSQHIAPRAPVHTEAESKRTRTNSGYNLSSSVSSWHASIPTETHPNWGFYCYEQSLLNRFTLESENKLAVALKANGNIVNQMFLNI